MNLSRALAAAAIAAVFNLSGAAAQSLSNGLVPKEFPPASYQGRQYVDSRGCVFIRAGVDGNVAWVPRVTRSRKIICGFQPTFATKAPALTPTQPTKVATVTPKKPPAALKKRVSATKAKRPAPMAATQVAATGPGGQSACRGGNAVSQQYVGRVGEKVRCGPQRDAFANSLRGRDQRRKGSAAKYRDRRDPARIVPSHVYVDQIASLEGITVPKGFKPAWDDDRLNPRRARQTRAGKAQMDKIWTQTIPRRLIRMDVGGKR